MYNAQPAGKHFDQYRDQYQANDDGTWTRFAADGPQYKAYGNSWGMPVFEWVGSHIDMMNKILKEQAA